MDDSNSFTRSLYIGRDKAHEVARRREAVEREMKKRREAKIREQNERLARAAQQKEQELKEKMKQRAEKELRRQRAVLDRRCAQLEVDKAKKAEILQKAHNFSSRPAQIQRKTVYAFGSSTPRAPTYLDAPRHYITKEFSASSDRLGSPGTSGDASPAAARSAALRTSSRIMGGMPSRIMPGGTPRLRKFAAPPPVDMTRSVFGRITTATNCGAAQREPQRARAGGGQRTVSSSNTSNTNNESNGGGAEGEGSSAGDSVTSMLSRDVRRTTPSLMTQSLYEVRRKTLQVQKSPTPNAKQTQKSNAQKPPISKPIANATTNRKTVPCVEFTKKATAAEPEKEEKRPPPIRPRKAMEALKNKKLNNGNGTAEVDNVLATLEVSDLASFYTEKLEAVAIDNNNMPAAVIDTSLSKKNFEAEQMDNGKKNGDNEVPEELNASSLEGPYNEVKAPSLEDSRKELKTADHKKLDIFSPVKTEVAIEDLASKLAANALTNATDLVVQEGENGAANGMEFDGANRQIGEPIVVGVEEKMYGEIIIQNASNSPADDAADSKDEWDSGHESNCANDADTTPTSLEEDNHNKEETEDKSSLATPKASSLEKNEEDFMGKPTAASNDSAARIAAIAKVTTTMTTTSSPAKFEALDAEEKDRESRRQKLFEILQRTRDSVPGGNSPAISHNSTASLSGSTESGMLRRPSAAPGGIDASALAQDLLAQRRQKLQEMENNTTQTTASVTQVSRTTQASILSTVSSMSGNENANNVVFSLDNDLSGVGFYESERTLADEMVEPVVVTTASDAVQRRLQSVFSNVNGNGNAGSMSSAFTLAGAENGSHFHENTLLAQQMPGEVISNVEIIRQQKLQQHQQQTSHQMPAYITTDSQSHPIAEKGNGNALQESFTTLSS